MSALRPSKSVTPANENEWAPEPAKGLWTWVKNLCLREEPVTCHLLTLQTWSYESSAGDIRVTNSRTKVGTTPGSRGSWGRRRLLLTLMGLRETASLQAV